MEVKVTRNKHAPEFDEDMERTATINEKLGVGNAVMVVQAADEDPSVSANHV